MIDYLPPPCPSVDFDPDETAGPVVEVPRVRPANLSALGLRVWRVLAAATKPMFASQVYKAVGRAGGGRWPTHGDVMALRDAPWLRVETSGGGRPGNGRHSRWSLR